MAVPGTLELFASDSPEFYEKVGWFSFPAVEDSDADPSIQIGTIGDQFISFNCEGEKLEEAFRCATYYTTDGAKGINGGCREDSADNGCVRADYRWADKTDTGSGSRGVVCSVVVRPVSSVFSSSDTSYYLPETV